MSSFNGIQHKEQELNNTEINYSQCQESTVLSLMIKSINQHENDNTNYSTMFWTDPEDTLQSSKKQHMYLVRHDKGLFEYPLLINLHVCSNPFYSAYKQCDVIPCLESDHL